MKNNPFTTITAGLAALLITPAFAIEAPEDNTPPPVVEENAAEQAPVAELPAPEQPQAENAGHADAREPIAFLGVHAMEIPEMLAQHLGLNKGGGIIVRALQPDGPAAKAGVAVNDVITSVGGKAVGSAMDLKREVKTHKPGETVRLDLIHNGKNTSLDVALGTLPDEIAGMDPRPLDQLNLDGIPKDMADRIRGMIEGNIGGIELNPPEGGLGVAPQMDEAMREMRQRMEKAMEGMKIPEIQGEANGVEAHQSATFRMMDDQGSVEYKDNNGSKEVTVRDKDNKVTWNGPWDTEQDKAAAPPDIRKRVDRLNIDTDFKGHGLRLKMLPPQQPDAE